MKNIAPRAISYLQKKFPGSIVQSVEHTLKNTLTGEQGSYWPMSVVNDSAGMRHRALVIPKLDSLERFDAILMNSKRSFEELEGSARITIGNTSKKQHSIDTDQFLIAPRVLVYTGDLVLEGDQVLSAMQGVGMIGEVVNEADLAGSIYRSVFISYGGPDAAFVTKINDSLCRRGVKTWYFPKDALPGEKLHRMMFEGVEQHDKVLLICSKASLVRPGVLNEIERVLEKEARLGGAEVLMPVRIDDYVIDGWNPGRRDIADQVKSRVITKIRPKKGAFELDIEKVVSALSK